MNQDILKGKWNQLKGNARKKWGKLTDDDMDRIQGNAEVMIGVLQERYGYGREQVEREINEFLSSSNVGGNTGFQQPRPTGQPGQTQHRKDQPMTGNEPSAQRGPTGQRNTNQPTSQNREDDDKRRRVS